MLGPKAKNTTPWRIYINTFGKQSAEGISCSLNSDGKANAYNSLVNQGYFLFDKIQNGEDIKTLTYEEATDFAGTIRHELGHALGIVFDHYKKNDQEIIDEDIADKRSWTMHIVDQNGNPARPGLPIVTSAKATDPNRSFVVDEEVTPDGKGYLYFVGEHVTEVLDGATFFGRSALPVNGWEESAKKGVYTFDGSHLETAGMMSHRDYTNYTSFLEVELAVMQDLGYQLDRRAYFGRSIYGNGQNIVNEQGYFKRNDEGTAYLDNAYSVVPLGTGLHIYGSNNTVTQNANILTVGYRLDGNLWQWSYGRTGRNGYCFGGGRNRRAF